MRIGADRLQVVLVRKKSIRGSGEAVAKVRRHRLYHIFLPQKAVAAARTEIRHGKIGHAAQALDLVPQFRLGLGIQNVEAELA